MQGEVGGKVGVFSNENDLAKFMQMYVQKGKYAGRRYLSSSSILSFLQIHLHKFC